MGDAGEVERFLKIQETEYPKIVNILKERLPKSANVYNMAATLQKFPKEMLCFTLDGHLSPESLILITFVREDYGQDIVVSLSENFEKDDDVKSALTATKAINWRGPHLFVAVDRKISTLLFEIDTMTFGNSIIFNPSYCYWMSPEDAKTNQNGDIVKKEFTVAKLEKATGVKFFLENWKSSRSGTPNYVSRIIERHLSAGAEVDKKLVGASLVSSYGFIGPIHTSPNYRRKGVASSLMKFLLREMANEGLIPVSSSAKNNHSYVHLHEKLGMKVSHEADWIFHTGAGNERLGTPPLAKRLKTQE